MRSISSYRINRLLLSGDYICCDSEGALYLLAQVRDSPQLHNIHLQGIVLPIEVIYMNEGATLYCCYPIEASMTQCLGRVRAHSLIASAVEQLMLSLTLTVMNAANDKTLKGELLACLHVANLWVLKNATQVIWHPRTDNQRYSEAAVVRRLAEMFFFLCFGREMTMQAVGAPPFNNQLIERMLKGGFTLQQTHQWLAQRQPSKRRKVSKGEFPQTAGRNKRYSVTDSANYRATGQSKRSSERTELSLEKSINAIRHGATTTHHPKESRRRLVSQKKKNSPVVSIANLIKYSESIKPSHSIEAASINSYSIAAAIHRQANREAIPQPRYVRYSQFISKADQPTEAVSISSLVLQRAMQAFEKQKMTAGTIDRTIDLQRRDQIVREHVSLEKERNDEMIATARKGMQMWDEQAGRQPREKDKRTYNLINRSNRMIQTRLGRPSEPLFNTGHFPLEIGEQVTPQSVKEGKPVLPTPQQEKFDRISQTSSKHSVDEKPRRNERVEQLRMPEVNLNVTNASIPSAQKPKVNEAPRQPGVPGGRLIQTNTALNTSGATLPPANPQKKEQAPPLIVEESREKLRQQSANKAADKPKPKPEMVVRKEEFEEIEEIPAYDREALTKTKPAGSNIKPADAKAKKEPKQTKDTPQELPRATTAAVKQPQPPKKRKQELSDDDQLEQITLYSKKPVAPPPKPPQPAPPSATTPKNQTVKTQNSQSSEKAAISIAAVTDQYVAFINLMGEAVGKSQKATKSLQNIDWFTGVFYIYKRFIRERKKIEQWLEEGVNKFYRGQKQPDQATFDKWLKSQHRVALLEKIRKDNIEIEKAIAKMHTTLVKKNVNPRVVKHSSLDRISEEESFIAIEYGLNEIDEILDLENPGDELLAHMVEILDALFIIAELDGKKAFHVNVMERRQMKALLPYFERQQDAIDNLRHQYGLT